MNPSTSIFPNTRLSAPVFAPELIVGTLRFLAQNSVREPFIMGSEGNYYYFNPTTNQAKITDGKVDCDGDFSSSDTGLDIVPYAVQDNAVTVEIFSWTEKELAQMKARSTEMNGVWEGAVRAKNTADFRNKYSKALQHYNDKIAQMILEKVGVNPVNGTMGGLDVTFTQFNMFTNRREFNDQWENYIQVGLSANGLGATSFSKILGPEAVVLKNNNYPTVTSGNGNIDLRSATNVFYQDNTYGRLIPEDGYGKMIYIQDGVVKLDHYSDILSIANITDYPTLPPNLQPSLQNFTGMATSIVGNEEAFMQLQNLATTFFENAAMGIDDQKAVWYDEQNRILWDVYFTAKNCKRNVARKMEITANPQVIFIDPKVTTIPGYTGIFTVNVERFGQASISTVAPPTIPAPACVTSILRDDICATVETFAAGTVVQLISGSVIAGATINVPITNSLDGIYRVLKALKSTGDGSYLGFQKVNVAGGGVLIKTSALESGTYTLALGECGDVTITVGDCEGDTVFANAMDLEIAANERIDNKAYFDTFTFSQGNPNVGLSSFQLPSTVAGVVAVLKTVIVSGAEEVTTLVQNTDWTFNETTKMIELDFNIVAGDKYSVEGFIY